MSRSHNIGNKDKRRIRRALEKRDGDYCWYCLRSGLTTLDHIVPRSQGGTNEITNMRLACGRCNQRKANQIIPLAVKGMWFATWAKV